MWVAAVYTGRTTGEFFVNIYFERTCYPVAGGVASNATRRRGTAEHISKQRKEGGRLLLWEQWVYYEKKRP